MDPLTIALAIYGGYQGYTSAKKAHANTLGQLFATAAGAYGGYNLGSGVTGLLGAGEAAGGVNAATAAGAGVESGIGALYNPTAIDPYAGTSLGMDTNAALSGAAQAQPAGIQTLNTQPQFQQLQPTVMNADYQTPVTQGVQTLSDSGKLSYEPQWAPGPNGTAQVAPAGYAQSITDRQPYGVTQGFQEAPTPNDDQSFGDKLSGYADKASNTLSKTFYDEKNGIKVGNAALVGIPALTYLSGAFERKPYERSMFTYNVNYPDLYRNRSFQVQDPKTGQVYNMPQQSYIPEEKAKAGIINPNQQFGPYKREVLTLNQGGLASLSHFREGGVTYLPTKVQNDETNEDNYMRANGYVEDSTGAGDKNEDTMLAQLADGEFVTRTDGVLGAGILAGANPGDEKQMKKLGADFFYEQQKRFKRIFDLLDASRKATQH